ncbi:class I SAM-dependent methyltransferase [Egibacter rhizosphaerae]|uniref:Class I SAM-dependent methyltransferase n=1 Tax=Egibacter rhizosphaerae TaxID=1670831 RepID=A0A411YCG9_9ACTN|nr:class I SAM-dependent methyltransferase [Egibacter rhizosphaerae]QBI18837.1 class I SAM-dependent methyltransferase [Egibacter rhizosphaerae]
MSAQGSGDHRGGERLPHDREASYAQTPPWDIGRPQAPFIALANAGHLHGAVLDLGCGTGEHALLAAEMGLPPTGVDLAPTAIATARDKARQRGLQARFLVDDALAVDMLDETFDVIIDCGFFHVLPDSARGSLVNVLGRVMASGAAYHLLCFSDRVPGSDGPRRIRQEEIRSIFAEGFSVESIAESQIEATFLDVPVPAWLARITR